MDKKRLMLLCAVGCGALFLIGGLVLLLQGREQQGAAEQTVNTLVEQLTVRQREAALRGNTVLSTDAETQISSILAGIEDISDPMVQRALQGRLPQVQAVLDVWRAQSSGVQETQKISLYQDALRTLDQALSDGNIARAKEALGILFTSRQQLLHYYR